MTAPQTPPAVRLTAVTKRFGGAIALAGTNLEVARGTIHGLVGQNGAGKSTLMKILAGIHRPDGGTIEIDGISQIDLTPRKTDEIGIHFIHQDRLLVPDFTVGEALFLGHEPRLSRFFPSLDRRAMAVRAKLVLREYFDIELPDGALIRDLTAAQKQIVQITRALLRRPSVLVFDEPTAALVRREAEILFQLIRRLRGEGITIIYISHYLAEIEELCDKVTVLRNGFDVGTVDPKVTPASAIASLMIDRELKDLFPVRNATKGEPRLTVRSLSSPGKYENVSFTVHRGEVVGVTGLLGSGGKDLIRTLFGLETAESGEIRIDDALRRLRSPVDAVRFGTALVPEDRRAHGVALDLDIAENITLAGLDRVSSAGVVNRPRERDLVDRAMEDLAIRATGRDAFVRTLSGGNQQKVVLAKWLTRQSGIYVLDEPTVGIDIGSKAEIYRLIAGLAEEGAAVVLLSTDLPELLGITDRVLVMYRGRVVSDVVSAETDAATIIAHATDSAEHPHVH